jgi:hypothetical protein
MDADFGARLGLATAPLQEPVMFPHPLLAVALAGAASILAPVTSSAQSAKTYTAEQLIDKNLQARGGADKLRAIKTLRTSGKLRFGGGLEAKSESFAIGPDKVRFELSLQGLTAVNAWDGGGQAWAIQPFQGRRDPQKISLEDSKDLMLAADIGGPLLDWKAKGSKVEYLGTEDVDGTEAHKLRIAFKNGDTRLVFLDPDHFLEIRVIDQLVVRGQEQISETNLGEYVQVDGVYFPFEQGQLEVESMQANTDIDAKIFSFPAAKP